MAKFPSRLPYVRLRQIPGDRLIHVIEAGDTISGRLYDVSYRMSSDDVPHVILEVRTEDPDLLGYGDEATVRTLEISAHRIVAADVDALDYELLGIPHLKQTLDSMRQWFVTEQPPCEHESVIEVTTLGDARAQGMCMWCGQRMVAEQQVEVTRGPWKPVGD